MNFVRMSRLLAVFVIVGIVAAPLVTQAAAKRLPVAEMGDMLAISIDMPCCPDTQSNDCQDCPLRVMCTLSTAQAEPALATGTSAPLPTRRPFGSRRNDRR